MPWTNITHLDHDRNDLRCADDCRDEVWKLIAPINTQRARIGQRRRAKRCRARLLAGFRHLFACLRNYPEFRALTW